MIGSITGSGRHSVVVDLAHYRACRRHSSLDRLKKDHEFYVAFATYLRKRAGRAGIDPDGLKRLGVAFDLRRVKLVSSLRSMLDEQYLVNDATIALGLVEHLDEVLALPTSRGPSAKTTAYQLAHALDEVATALETRLSSAHATRR
jgi:hypothetical protein